MEIKNPSTNEEGKLNPSTRIIMNITLKTRMSGEEKPKNEVKNAEVDIPFKIISGGQSYKPFLGLDEIS
jgi:hypothetical protein